MLHITLWIGAKSFLHVLNDKNATWQDIHAMYLAVQQFSRLINKTLGSFVIWLQLEYIFGFATSIDEIFIEGGALGIKYVDWHRVIRYTAFIIISVGFSIFSSEICRLVS